MNIFTIMNPPTKEKLLALHDKHKTLANKVRYYKEHLSNYEGAFRPILEQKLSDFSKEKKEFEERYMGLLELPIE